MKTIRLLGLVLLLAFVPAIESHAEPAEGTIFQVSTLAALLEGAYDGQVTFAELKKRGNFGLGTLNALDGEMIAVDREFYQVRANGKVFPIADSEKTPFAVVTTFKAEKFGLVTAAKNLQELQEQLDRMLPEKDAFFAVKILGIFPSVKVRSVPRQEPPYPGLEEALKHQTVRELERVAGVVVGFYFPEYIGTVSVPGYHFHFITADRQAGGHLLDCRVDSAGVEIASSSALDLRLLTGVEAQNPLHRRPMRGNRAPARE